MTIARRSASQILHGFLPGQTVDLNGGIFKVSEWRTPRYLQVDKETLRNELLRLARPWEVNETDAGFGKRLRRGEPFSVVSLDRRNGVAVERFPQVWQCRSCNRVTTKRSGTCKCGAESWGQLHFVGYHSCGRIQEPYIPLCPAHKDCKIVFPGSADASQIRFECPVCSRLLRQGFGFPQCDCGRGQINHNVHRAASVFSPRSVAIVNAISPERLEQVRSAGGRERSLAWVVSGMPSGGTTEGIVDKGALIAQLVGQGFDEAIAKQMADIAQTGGQVAETAATDGLGPAQTQLALDQAVTIVSATGESRRTVEDLINSTSENSTLGRKYRSNYPLAQHRAGLEGVELLDQFPVLTGNFGYTRGDSSPGTSTLRTFKNRRQQHVIYADLQETEALFFRLDPVRVLEWLRSRGHPLDATDDPSEARRVILRAADVPEPGSELDAPTVGSDLLDLIHSFSHRMVRQLAVFAGLDRNSLSELLVAAHLGFFIYASARGDFVLGGLQAVFETELERLLETFITAEQRCAMDPGCTTEGAACVACLHLGEPSCRYFNRYLDRRVLFGEQGYLRRV